MTDLRELVKQLRESYSDYEKNVQIVCCWHSRFKNWVKQGVFDHYPVRSVAGRNVTPDFLVDFGDYVLVGEICKLPNQAQGFTRSLDQAKKYLDIGPETDVLLLIPHQIASQCEMRISDENLLSDEHVVVVSFIRDDASEKCCWVFTRPTQLRSISFRDAFLGEKSLHWALTEKWKPITILQEYGLTVRPKFPFVNDQPPPLYTACYLWHNVFNQLTTPEEMLERTLKGESRAITGVSAAKIRSVCLSMDIKMNESWASAALELLIEARLAETKDHREYTILSYPRIRARRGGGSHELQHQIIERLANVNLADLEGSDGQRPGQLSMALTPEALLEPASEPGQDP